MPSLPGRALARRERVDAVIEIGGVSTMDPGKATAFGTVHENLEDYIKGRFRSDERHLFNIIIPTYPSTGSKANGVCDIMEYKGHGTERFSAWPDVCLMDPGATLSLNRQSMAYSILICFIQTASWFMGNYQNDIATDFAKTVLRTLLKSYEKLLLADQADVRPRENVMWASCVNTKRFSILCLFCTIALTARKDSASSDTQPSQPISENAVPEESSAPGENEPSTVPENAGGIQTLPGGGQWL